MTTYAADSVLEHGVVVLHDRVVAAPLAFSAGRVAEPRANAYVVDLRDHLIFPGLVNAHDHLQLNAVPPLTHVEPFANSYAWIDAFEPHRQSAAVIAAVSVSSAARHRHGGLKNLLAGVTTVAHHDPWCGVLDEPDFPVGLVRKFGWSHSLGLGTKRFAPRYGPPVVDSFRATPTTHPWMIHLAEGTDDEARGELACLEALGCLASNTVIVHGAGLSSADIHRVIERGASVVWCPASNLGMLGRTLDPRPLANARRLALGSDSRLTGSRDLLDELRVAAAHSDLSPSELLRLVTANASSVVRLPECGGLDVGQNADCLIVRAERDPYRALLGAGRSALRAVVRGGAPAIADRDFAAWFAHCGVPWVEVLLDGRPKLLAARLAAPEIVAMEPGLELA